MSPKMGELFGYDLKVNEHVPANQKCDVCDTPLSLRWTDFHGFAICRTCHVGYDVYHYEKQPDGTEKLMSTIPVISVKPESLPQLRQIWTETQDFKTFVERANQEFSQ